MKKCISTEIDLFDDPDDGLRVECVEPHLAPITRALLASGFRLGAHQLKISGTATLPSIMEMPVSDGTFDTMKVSIYDSLVSQGVTVKTEDFSLIGEKHIRFTLDNVDIYGN